MQARFSDCLLTFSQFSAKKSGKISIMQFQVLVQDKIST